MKLIIILFLSGALFSCASSKALKKTIYVHDSNKDGVIDEYRYYIGSGVYIYTVDSNFDGVFDLEYSMNRAGVKYSDGKMTSENPKNVLEINAQNADLIFY